MKVFADTNFFTNLWLKLSHTPQAKALLMELLKSGAVLPVTRLLRMELTNALQRLIYESRNGSQGLRVSPEFASMARAEFDSQTASREFLEQRNIPDDVLEAEFDRLVYRYTASEGFRTYDIMHVASALALGCDTFWSFDARAKRLAAMVGLSTNA
jgi:predicted nucleic acid-binding protein